MAVLINKAMIEIPPKFAGRPPVNPESQGEPTVIAKTWRGAQGLAEDVRHYGQWLRDEAKKRIGHLYPPVEVTSALVRERPDLKPYEGRKLTVIAWLWARTVKSPNPAFADVDVPLVSTFMLSTKTGKEAYVEPVIEGRGYRFEVKVGAPSHVDAAEGGDEAVTRRELPLPDVRFADRGRPHSRPRGRPSGCAPRLMAVVAEGDRGRVLHPSDRRTRKDRAEGRSGVATGIEPCHVTAAGSPPPLYGLPTYGDIFTLRQLVALTTFSDLVGEATERVRRDAAAAGQPDDGRPLRDGGTGATAYAEAVAVYLAFALSKVSDRGSTLGRWDQTPTQSGIINTFSRQALPMTWDFGESNPVGEASGSFVRSVDLRCEGDTAKSSQWRR